VLSTALKICIFYPLKIMRMIVSSILKLAPKKKEAKA